MRPDIYELLAAQQASATTTTQLHNAVKSTFIDSSNVEFWAGVITVSRALHDSRMNGQGGLPIPESSAVQTYALGDGETINIQPSGSQIYLLQNVAADSCNFFLTDGTTEAELTFSATGGILTPIYLTNSCFLTIKNGSGGGKNPRWAYHMVSL